jgi:hypothetical protein
MLPFSSAYMGAVAAPHRVETRIRVFHDGVDVTPVDGVPIIDGTIQAAFTSRVTRSVQLTVPGTLFPVSPDDLLSPYQAIIEIESGIRYLDGTPELFPLFTGRVYEATMTADGLCEIRGDDLASDVIAYRFESPENSQFEALVVGEMRRLITEVIADADFGPDNVVDRLVPRLSWDEDRGSALDDLASALHARWYTLGNGNFVVRMLPYGEIIPVVTIEDGPGGIVSSATRTFTRDGAANSVVVLSERADGTDPIRVVRRDMTPGSPTEFGGPFGKVSQIIRPQTPVSVAGAFALASQQLVANLALGEQWSVDLAPLDFLEPGDAVKVRYRGQEADQIIDSMTYPLVAGTMSIRTRSMQAEPITE